MEVPESLFSCQTLTSLYLENFKMRDVPALFKGFSQLETCYLENVELSEEAFKVILEFCRRLQILTVFQCKLPSNLRIISSSLKSLTLLGPMRSRSILSIDCPRLESIKVKCLGLDLKNIILPVCVHLETDFELLQEFATVKSLRKITCCGCASLTSGKDLQSFSHLEELRIDSRYFFLFCPKDITESTLQLTNLKSFTVDISLYGTDDEVVDYEDYDEVVSLCSWVLKGAPLLKTVRIGMDYRSGAFGPDGFDYSLQFVNNILSLSRGFPKTKISLFKRIVRLVSPGGRSS